MGSLGGALGQIGQTLGDLPSNIYQQTGLPNVGAGLQSLFGGGEQTAAAQPGFVGPPSPFESPNFLQGVVQGFLGQNPGGGADVPGAPAQVGGGLGQLLNLLEELRKGGAGGGLSFGAPQAGGMTPGGIRLLPGYRPAQAPSGGLVHKLIGAATYGILGGGIPSSGQV